jgi:Flp pilus assembly protein TadD
MLIQLEDDARLDIPAGDADFAVEDKLQLPEDVDLLAIYPHAHYLGKRMEGWAELPGGGRKELIVIESWDIDRQAIYRYAKPIFLPAKSVVHMRYTYDNTAENPHNPNSPPIRVKAGNRSADEMGHLWLQVLPRATATGEDLRAPLLRAWMEHRLDKDPHDPIALFNVASLEMSDGRFERAAELYRKTLAAQPDDVRTVTALASAVNKTGNWKQALELLRKAIGMDGTYADAQFDLGVIELQNGDLEGAEKALRAVIALQPGDAAAHSTLGGVLLANGKAAEARVEFETALKSDDRNFEALFNLAMIELDAGEVAQSLEHLKTAEVVNPDDVDVHRALAEIYGKRGQAADALREQKAANLKGTR